VAWSAPHHSTNHKLHLVSPAVPFRVPTAICLGSILKFSRTRKCAAALAMSTILPLAAIVGSSPLSSQTVGVTSATVGDPVGKPPLEVERILHVGVDVKAKELITTGPADRAHLLFLDGTALSVGPEAQLVIDNFVYDSNQKLGELSISATRGVFRFVGGHISKMKAVTITTPSNTIAIRGGIMMVAVEPAETKATFVYGHAMTVTGRGQSQVVTRPGWAVRTIAGNPPEQAMAISRAALAGQMGMLERPGGPPAGSAGPAGAPKSAPSPGGPAASQASTQHAPPNARAAAQGDEAIAKSGLPDVNSGRGPHGQGPVTAGALPGQGRGDGPGKGGPPLAGDPSANRPLLPETMGSSSGRPLP
jgi:hypothetical protein